MKAMLIWSDGHSLNYTIFEDKDNKTGFERAQEQMFKEYDERDNDFEADPNAEPVKLRTSAVMKQMALIVASGRS